MLRKIKKAKYNKKQVLLYKEATSIKGVPFIKGATLIKPSISRISTLIYSKHIITHKICETFEELKISRKIKEETSIIYNKLHTYNFTLQPYI